MNHIGQISVRDYHRLPSGLQQQLDDWLKGEGLDKSNIFHMELFETGAVNVYVFLRDRNGNRYMDPKIDAPAQAVVLHACVNPPPEGVFK